MPNQNKMEIRPAMRADTGGDRVLVPLTHALVGQGMKNKRIHAAATIISILIWKAVLTYIFVASEENISNPVVICMMKPAQAQGRNRWASLVTGSSEMSVPSGADPIDVPPTAK